MPGIKKLTDIYKKKGITEVEKFLSGNLKITEKIDAHRFSFQINEDGNIKFYKKNDNRAITKVDRIVSDLYESAIVHIENLPRNVINNIPKNLRFGFSYFPSKKPLRIQYSSFNPENNLVLTDITKRNENGKVKKVYENEDYLIRWSEILNVSRPPILFQGKLDENQKSEFIKLIKGKADVNNKILKTFFTKHVESLFEKTYTNNNIIQGIVVRGKNGLGQLVDPSYELFLEANTPDVSRDFYDLILIQITNFINEYELPIVHNYENVEDRYIELISEAFNSFIEKGDFDGEMDYKFLQPNIIGEIGNINKKFINNKKTLKFIQESKLNEELFKVFLLTHRRDKKAHGLLTEKDVSVFNQNIKRIKECIKGEFSTFEEFTELHKTSINEDILNENIQDFEIISSLQTAFNYKSKSKNKEYQDSVDVLVIENKTINNNIINIINELEESVYVFYLSNEKMIDDGNTFYLSDNLMNVNLSLLSEYNENVIGFEKLNIFSLDRIKFILNSKKLDIKNIVVPVGNYSIDIEKQFKLNRDILGNKMNLDNVKIIEYKNEKIHSKVNRGIEDDKNSIFSENVPKYINSIWDNIRSEYVNWSSSVDLKINQT